MRQCVYAHCACRWDAWSRCQKWCIAGLVGAQRTVQNNGNVKSEHNTWLWRLSNTCFLLLNTFLFSCCSLGSYGGLTSLPFFSDTKPLAAFSTHFWTWLRRIRMLQRPSRAALPALHHPKMLSQCCVIHISVMPEFLTVSANWHSKRDWHIRTHICTYTHP